MIEGVDYDKLFLIETNEICLVDKIEKDFLERHQDLEIVKIIDALDNGKKFGVWAKKKETK